MFRSKSKNQDIYKKAAKRVRSKKRFFYHFLFYAFTLALLSIILKYDNGGDYIPVFIVALSWGSIIAIHYFKAFGTEQLGFLGVNTNWEEDELEKEIQKLTYKRELKEELEKERNLLKDSEELVLKKIEKMPSGGGLDLK